jgi:hypothetical protein
MEQSSRADEIATCLKVRAAIELDVIQLVAVSEVPVDQRGIQEQPEMLRWLTFRRYGGQDQQMHILWHTHDRGTTQPKASTSGRPVKAPWSACSGTFSA